MFKPITTLVIVSQGLWFLTAEIPAGGTDALSVDWSSWPALIESMSGPLALRLAGWLVLGCALGICMSFLVRNFRMRRALVGGTFGGLVAAGVFLMAMPRLGEMAGHLLAAAVLGLIVTLMVARARAGAQREGGKEAADQGSKKSAPAAPKQSSAAPPPEPEAAPTAPSPTVPAPDTKAQAGDQSASPSEPKTQGAEQSAPAPEAQPAPAGDASSPPPEATAKSQKARKKSSVLPSPKKVSPKKPNAPAAPDWMKGHD